MALFLAADNTKMQEVKEYVPVSKAFSFTDLLPFINAVERDHIKPLIGTSLYNALSDYNQNGSGSASSSTETSDANLSTLLPKVKEAIANLAFAEGADVLSLNIDSSGIRITVNENKKQAFQWQVENVKRKFYALGFTALEDALQHLEDNISSYPEWEDSDAFDTYREFFFSTAKDFSKYYNINNSRLTFISLKHILRKVEDMYIKPIMSEAFYNEIKAAFQDPNVTSAQQLVINKIKPALAYLTISHACSENYAQIKHNGIYINRIQYPAQNTKVPLDNSMLTNIARDAYRDGQNYLNQLRDFLMNNANDYGTFKTSDEYASDSVDGTLPITSKRSILF